MTEKSGVSIDGEGIGVKMNYKLYIVAPAYNESGNIKKFINDWYPVIENYAREGVESRLVVVDDGSTDNTYDILCESAETKPLLKPLTKPNGGHGAAVLYGYRYAVANNADYIFQTDSDGQTDPLEFGQFWDLKDQYDAIIGKRLVRQDGVIRKFVEDVLCCILRIIFGIKVQDANAPFRLMKVGLVEKYIRKMPENFNLPNVMLTTYFIYFHERVKFIEITFKPRQAGKNSIDLKKIAKIGWNALKDFKELRKQIDMDVGKRKYSMGKTNNITVNMNFVIYLYLYIPILIFFLGWVKWNIAIPLAFLIVLMGYKIKKEDSAGSRFEMPSDKGVFILIGCVVFLFVWCVLSGQGAYTLQADDWTKHNILLEDLINYEWPVRYQYNGQGVMDYYLAGYLLPALFGKIKKGGVRTAEIILLLWTCMGLLFTCMGIYVFLKCKKEWKIVIICAVLFLFSTFIVPLSGIYRILCPEDIGDGYYWLSATIKIQYTGNVTLLRWVFPQFVPTAAAMAGLLTNRRKVKNWGIMCAPLVLYSTFCFVGVVAIIVEFFILDTCLCNDRKGYFRRAFHWKNICSVVVAGTLSIYILGNVLQTKPEDSGMGFEWIDYTGHGVLWILFQLSWLFWCIILLKNEYKNHLLYCAGSVLFLLPACSFGTWNDLVMRSSIPALFILCTLVMKNIVNADMNKVYRNLLIGCLILNAVGGVNELVLAVRESVGYMDNRSKCMGNGEFMAGSTGWQYVNWDEENSVVQWIIR